MVIVDALSKKSAVNKLFLIVLSLLFLACSAFQKEDLKQFKWKNRILIMANSEKENLFKKNKEDYFKEFKDRDLIIIEVIDGEVFLNDQLASQSLSQSVLSVVKDELADKDLILIGKDGKIKHRYHIDDISLILKDIDSMPMRIREINK